jgi:hypothetical protein
MIKSTLTFMMTETLSVVFNLSFIAAIIWVLV